MERMIEDRVRKRKENSVWGAEDVGWKFWVYVYNGDI